MFQHCKGYNYSHGPIQNRSETFQHCRECNYWILSLQCRFETCRGHSRDRHHSAFRCRSGIFLLHMPYSWNRRAYRSQSDTFQHHRGYTMRPAEMKMRQHCKPNSHPRSVRTHWAGICQHRTQGSREGTICRLHFGTFRLDTQRTMPLLSFPTRSDTCRGHRDCNLLLRRARQRWSTCPLHREGIRFGLSRRILFDTFRLRTANTRCTRSFRLLSGICQRHNCRRFDYQLTLCSQ